MSTYRPAPPGDRQGPPGLPVGYLQGGYFDGKGNLLPQVVQDWPRQIAQALVQARPQMKMAQLRGRFFTEVRRLENKLNAVKDYDTIRPEVLKLAAFAEDAVNKAKVPQLFKEFIGVNLRFAGKDEKSFRGFVSHLECVVAYFPERGGR